MSKRARLIEAAKLAVKDNADGDYFHDSGADIISYDGSINLANVVEAILTELGDVRREDIEAAWPNYRPWNSLQATVAMKDFGSMVRTAKG